MTLFTKFKKAKEAADEHKKTTAAQQARIPSAPYRHIPTHAEQDALASHPTSVRPEELQARIAAARKRRASSYQPPLAARHSVYHACESSRASSRTNSTAAFSPGSTPPSLKGKGNSASSIDAVMQQSRSLSHRHSSQVTNGQLQHGGSLGPPAPVNHRSRPNQTMSRRSSFAKKKSPLSNVSVDEETDEVFSSSSNTSAVSSQSSRPDDLQRDNKNGKGPVHPSQSNYDVNRPQPTASQSVRRRHRWSILPRKSIDIAAH